MYHELLYSIAMHIMASTNYHYFCHLFFLIKLLVHVIYLFFIKLYVSLNLIFKNNNFY